MISISINLDSHKVHLASPTILAFSINEILGTLFFTSVHARNSSDGSQIM